jgi:hypothetical protein
MWRKPNRAALCLSVPRHIRKTLLDDSVRRYLNSRGQRRQFLRYIDLDPQARPRILPCPLTQRVDYS